MGNCEAHKEQVLRIDSSSKDDLLLHITT